MSIPLWCVIALYASEIRTEYAIPLDVPYADESVVSVAGGDGRVATRLETTVSGSRSELELVTADRPRDAGEASLSQQFLLGWKTNCYNR